MDEIYKKLLSIRTATELKVKKNPYLRDEIVLRHYQVQMMIHLFILKRMVVGDDCGTGKTCQVISAYTSLLVQNPELKLLVVAPASALYQWQSEFEKFTTGIKCQIVESTPIKVNKKTIKGAESREYQFSLFENDNKNVLILNYNTLVSDNHILEDLLKKYKVMVIFDEATAFKNPKTKAFSYAAIISKLAERVYSLSATIVKNNLIEAYSIFKITLPNLFGSIEKFKRDYCIIEQKSFWVGKHRRRFVNIIKGYKNLDFFKKTIDPYFLGRKKSDVAKELPEIITKEIVIQMNDKQQDIYDEAVKGILDFDRFKNNAIDYILADDDSIVQSDIKLIDKLTALIYCQQICNSPQIVGFSNTISSSKEDEFLRLITHDLVGEKVVVYTRFKKMIERLRKKLDDENIPNTWISGELKSQEREAHKKLFNESSECNIIFINAAAKEAINLQSSAYLLFYDMPFSYGDFLQIVGRIHRIGNKHENIFLIYLICKGSVDEKVYNTLLKKKDLFDVILGDSAVGALRTSNFVDNIFNDLVAEAKKSSK